MTDIPKVRMGTLFLPMLLLAFSVSCLLWTAVLPFDRAHDEMLHYRMVEFLAAEGRVPVFGPDKDMYGFLSEDTGPQSSFALDPIVPKSSYALHPTAPYFLPALLYKVAEGQADGEAFHTVRLASVLLGMGTVVVAYLMGRLLFPGQQVLRHALPVFVAFQPQFVFMHSYVNNDAFSFLAASLVIYLTARELLLERDTGNLGAAFLGVAIGLVLVSKLNAYVLLPFAVLAYGWSLVQRPRALVVRFAVVGLAALAIGGWWFLWNYVTYGGDILALGVNREAWMLVDPTWRSLMDAGLTWPEMLFMVGYWWVITFVTYWGSFGPAYLIDDFFAPSLALKLGPALLALGSLVGLRYWVSASFGQWGLTAERKNVVVLLGMLAAVLALTLVSFANSLVNAYEPQGRYLLPAVIPISALVLLGFAHYRPTPVRNDWLVLGCTYFVMGLGLFCLFAYVVPGHYRGHSSYLGILTEIASNNAWFFNLPALVFLSVVLCASSAALALMLLQLCRQAVAREEPAGKTAVSQPIALTEPL